MLSLVVVALFSGYLELFRLEKLPRVFMSSPVVLDHQVPHLCQTPPGVGTPPLPIPKLPKPFQSLGRRIHGVPQDSNPSLP